MKITIKVAMIFIATVYSFGLKSQCVNGISTNPKAPRNEQIPNIFGTGSEHIFLNKFNWFGRDGAQVNNIPININAGFILKGINPQNGVWVMHSPYHSSMGSKYSYLYAPGKQGFLDNQWVDGWELLWMNTGYYPNGDPVTKPNFLVPSNGRAFHDKIPYIIIYNRYRGIVRVFANLFSDFGKWDMLNISLEFDEKISSDRVSYSGLLRHLQPYDRPLDLPTETVIQRSFNQNAQRSDIWVSTDFQIAYDPCTCFYPSMLKLGFEAIDSMRIEMKGRALSVEKDLIKNVDSLKNFLNTHDIKSTSAGQVIYHNMKGMANDYIKKQKEYEQKLAAYNAYKSSMAFQAMEFAKDGIIDGLPNVVPAAPVAKFLVNKMFKNRSDSAKNAEADNLASEMTNGVKSLLSDNYDFLTTQVAGPAPKKPAPLPARPVVGMQELNFTGKIFNETSTLSGAFMTPGSYAHAYDNPTQIEAQAYPIYNEVLGMFALLKRPKFSLYYKPKMELSPAHNVSDKEVKVTGKRTDQFRIRLTEKLKWHLNPALDFDYDKTTVYAKLIVNFKHPENPLAPVKYHSIDRKFINGNWWELDRVENICPTNGATKYDECHNFQVSTLYFDINEMSEEEFYFDIESDMISFMTGPEIPPFREKWLRSNAHQPQIESIKLKIMADMNFHQKGSNDREVNTTQVLTYLLYGEKEKGSGDYGPLDEQITLVESEREALSFQNKSLVIGGLIGTNHPYVWEVEDRVIYIKARDIKVIANLTAPAGYELMVMAKNEIEVVPETEIGENVTLWADGFKNIGKSHMTTWSEIQSFCQRKGQYKGNTTIHKRANTKEKKQEQESTTWTTALQVFPNPATDVYAIRVDAAQATEASIGVYDLSGRSVHQETVQLEAGYNAFRYSSTDYSTGIYIIAVEIDGVRTTQKLVIARQ